MLYPQNGDCIVATDSVTSRHPVYTPPSLVPPHGHESSSRQIEGERRIVTQSLLGRNVFLDTCIAASVGVAACRVCRVSLASESVQR